MPSLGTDEQPLDLSATQTCPFCGGLNVQDALFCEECGYDFTTGTPPMGSEPELVVAMGEIEAVEAV
ncbi:MAG: hypothetical protein Q4P07_08410, partial [Ornithinimicrobium sp.]|nr:hypothetical protein [Ornithinimicrobium sp.]